MWHWLLSMSAERAGFEPAVPLWGTLTFQASTFSHSATSPEDFIFLQSDPSNKEINNLCHLQVLAVHSTNIRHYAI